MPDLSSVVPAPRFKLAATMGYYFFKTWNPRDNFEFFLKNHPAKILHWAPRESLSLGIRNAKGQRRDSGWCSVGTLPQCAASPLGNMR